MVIDKLLDYQNFFFSSSSSLCSFPSFGRRNLIKWARRKTLIKYTKDKPSKDGIHKYNTFSSFGIYKLQCSISGFWHIVNIHPEFKNRKHISSWKLKEKQNLPAGLRYRLFRAAGISPECASEMISWLTHSPCLKRCP